MSNPEIIVVNEDRVLVDGDPAVSTLSQGCDDCVFKSKMAQCTQVPCCPSERGDGNYVIFIWAD